MSLFPETQPIQIQYQYNSDNDVDVDVDINIDNNNNIGLDYLLICKYNLQLVQDNTNHLIYTFTTNETSYIEIDATNKHSVKVSVPVPNSIYQYRTQFCSVECAHDYINNIF